MVRKKPMVFCARNVRELEKTKMTIGDLRKAMGYKNPFKKLKKAEKKGQFSGRKTYRKNGSS